MPIRPSTVPYQPSSVPMLPSRLLLVRIYSSMSLQRRAVVGAIGTLGGKEGTLDGW
ncbi:hypothetical protein R4198_22200 [Williamsia muralis]|uniref:Uncharacterized protein n=1 Tax=Williamsia marianensis TaxID=85044 RepID=A0ABU4EYT3_WILMA|nr:hypothetical protein [Williamsia muralis]